MNCPAQRDSIVLRDKQGEKRPGAACRPDARAGRRSSCRRYRAGCRRCGFLAGPSLEGGLLLLLELSLPNRRQLGDLLFQRRILRTQCRKLLEKLFNRGAEVGRRYHPNLGSCRANSRNWQSSLPRKSPRRCGRSDSPHPLRSYDKFCILVENLIECELI